MRKIILFSAIVFILFAHANAQGTSQPGKICMVFTGYLNFTADNMNTNIDSLIKIYKENFYDKNPFFLNTRIIRHYYGHDSREVLIISELKDWDDIPKASAKGQELMSKMPNRDKFWSQISQLITPEHHSDEIYYVVSE
jgi:hypothetical protein